MLIVVSVMYWASFYMSGESNKLYFSLLTLSFAASMFLLLFSESMILLFVGWEGLGITSYLLIGFYQSWESVNNSLFTYLTMRIGDVLFLMSIFFHPLLFLFLLSSTKSAVFPFMAWLPKAMSAPTPISALVHSSTLVTAGIFLLYKSEMILSGYSVLFLMTLIFSSLLGSVEKDGKKIIALSTLSQLAFILLLMGSGYYFLSVLHLVVHGFFKSLLFLQSGSMIHASWSEQYSSRMGVSMSSSLLSVYNLSIFTLMGMPFLSGMITKDLFITHLSFFNILFWVSIGLTFIYSLSLLSVGKKSKLFSSLHKEWKGYAGIVLFLLALMMSSSFVEDLVSWEKSVPFLYFLLFLAIVVPASNFLNFTVFALKEGGKFLEKVLNLHFTIKLSPLLFLLF